MVSPQGARSLATSCKEHRALPEESEEALTGTFNSDIKTSPRWYFHTTTVERFADIAFETLKKHGLLSKEEYDYSWWDITLPA